MYNNDIIKDRGVRKIKSKFVFAIFFIVSLLIIYLTISMFNNLKQLDTLFYSNEIGEKQTGLYRIALIYQDNDIFTDLLTQGAQQAATEQGVDLKIFSSNPTDQFTVNDYFELALLANFDGIIVDGESPDLVPLIECASKKGVPVVTILSDLPGSDRISYVGVNNHRAGYIVGREMLRQIQNQTPKLAVVSTDFTEENFTPAAEYLKIFGFKEAISARPGALIVTWQKAKPRMLDALQTVTKILAENPGINGIFATHSVATIAAANILSDKKNKDIILIGYGDDQEIKNYLKRGIVHATLTINPHHIGANAVREIKSYLDEKKVNLYSSIDIDLLTRDRILETSGEVD